MSESETIKCRRSGAVLEMETCRDSYTKAMRQRSGACFGCTMGAAVKLALMRRDAPEQESSAPAAPEPQAPPAPRTPRAQAPGAGRKPRTERPRAGARPEPGPELDSTDVERGLALALHALWTGFGVVVEVGELRARFEAMVRRRVHHKRFAAWLAGTGLALEKIRTNGAPVAGVVLDEKVLSFVTRVLGAAFREDLANRDSEPRGREQAQDVPRTMDEGETRGACDDRTQGPGDAAVQDAEHYDLPDPQDSPGGELAGPADAWEAYSPLRPAQGAMAIVDGNKGEVRFSVAARDAWNMGASKSVRLLYNRARQAVRFELRPGPARGDALSLRLSGRSCPSLSFSGFMQRFGLALRGRTLLPLVEVGPGTLEMDLAAALCPEPGAREDAETQPAGKTE